jgi:hypothetical protein
MVVHNLYMEVLTLDTGIHNFKMGVRIFYTSAHIENTDVTGTRNNRTIWLGGIALKF